MSNCSIFSQDPLFNALKEKFGVEQGTVIFLNYQKETGYKIGTATVDDINSFIKSKEGKTEEIEIIDLDSPQVNYQLKAVDILLSDKAKQVFDKGEKSKWDLNKILTELAIPKKQKELLLDLGVNDNIIVDFYDKQWRNDITKSNKAKSFAIKNKPNEKFELVKDHEDGYYSIHFKTTKGSLTEQEKDILITEIANEIPLGGKLSTWGEVSKGGLSGINRFLNKGFIKVGERTVSDNQVIPILKKIEQLDKPLNEQLALELASKYGFSVEINTAKETKDIKEQPSHGESINFNLDNNKYSTKTDVEADEDGLSYITRYFKNEKEITSSEYYKAKEKASNLGISTQYYSNLSAPGGTNYTENEISTPLITPSIKGHAQFATDKGIGWFRSDDRDNSGITHLSSEDRLESNYEYNRSSEQFNYNGSIYKEVTESEPGLGSYNTYYKDGKEISSKEYREAFNNKPKKDNSKTRRILEVQSDWGQKQRKQSDPDMMINFNETKFLQDLQYAGDLKIECD